MKITSHYFIHIIAKERKAEKKTVVWYIFGKENELKMVINFVCDGPKPDIDLKVYY